MCVCAWCGETTSPAPRIPRFEEASYHWKWSIDPQLGATHTRTHTHTQTHTHTHRTPRSPARVTRTKSCIFICSAWFLQDLVPPGPFSTRNVRRIQRENYGTACLGHACRGGLSVPTSRAPHLTLGLWCNKAFSEPSPLPLGDPTCLRLSDFACDKQHGPEQLGAASTQRQGAVKGGGR